MHGVLFCCLLALTHPRTWPPHRLEATYEIREDIADVLRRVGAYWDDDNRVRFAGWARMGVPITSFKVRAHTREGQQGRAWG